MKESVTKFDLESAFKALDEIDFPAVEKGIRANRPALTEIFSHKSKFDALFEEYYDIDSAEGLDDAKAAREAEVAKAKLDRIEKIVDLDADSPEDLLTSYVGKYIMQCPQCMTLFYKDKEDIVEAEDDPSTVNVSEICQHCGNESGYTLIGKVGEAEAESSEELPADPEMEEPDEAGLEAPEEEPVEISEDDIDIDLDAINFDDEKTEEAFTAHTGEVLVEDIQEDKDLDAKLEAHSEYIEYLRNMISQEEVALEKTENAQVKAAIQRNIDAFKADLENALPEAVKNDEAVVEDNTTESTEEVTAEEAAELDKVVESLTEALHEETELDVSPEEFNTLINELPAITGGVSPEETAKILASEASEASEDLEEANIFDKILHTRAAKADWLKDALGKTNYVVIGYKNRFSNNTLIQRWVEADNKYLIIDNNKVKTANTLAEAEKIAKEFYVASEYNSFTGSYDYDRNSEANTNVSGPIFIYLGKNATDPDKVYLCQYFEDRSREGQHKFKVFNDKIDELYTNTRNGLKSKKEAVEVTTAQEALEEGIFDKFPITRVQKANWIKNHALIDYTKMKVNDKGELVPDVSNQQFDAFRVICFNGKYSNGKSVAAAPDYRAAEQSHIAADANASGYGGAALVLEKDQEKADFKDAEKLAKGWSKLQGNGPAFVYLQSSKDKDELRFLCQYFDGELVNQNNSPDCVEKYFNIIKKDLKGRKDIAKSGGFSESYTAENLTSVMNELDDLQEEALEKAISDSLVEAYGNVAGFRFNDCSYLNEKLAIDGTIYFTSGNTRKTTYTFSKAFGADNKISIVGLNEKLGLDKQFTITGYTDNKTFITESFKCSKK